MHATLPRWSGALLTAVAAAAAAVAIALLEPSLQQLVGRGIWQTLRLDTLPVRAVPLLLAGSLLALPGAWLLRRLGSLESAFIVAALAAVQMNGLRFGPLDTFDLAVFGYFAVWLAARALDPAFAIELPPVVFFGAGFLILQLPHLINQAPVGWAIGLFGMTRAVLVALLLVNACRDQAALATFRTALIAVATISASIAIAQFLLGWLAGIHFTLIRPAEDAFKPTPLGFVMRASGLCITAQHLSGFLVFASPFALWRLSQTWRLRDGAIVLILWTGILFSWNFGAILAAGAIAGAFLFLRWPHLSIHFVLAGLTLAVALYFSGYFAWLWDLSFGDKGVMKGVEQRTTLFKLGLEQLDRHPWTGTGLQAFSTVSGNYWHRPVHNLLGQAATELGVVGALLFLAMVFTLFTQAMLLAMGPPRPGRDLLRQVVLVFIGFFVLMQSEPMLDNANTWLVLGFAQAAITVASLRRAAPPGPPARVRA